MRFDQKINDVFSEDVIIEKNCVELSNNKKKYIAKLWDGTRIFLVDGEEVRNNDNVAFFGGAHPKYDDCKTKKEIWIEKIKGGAEESKLLVHEIIEFIMMKYVHMSYDRAHNIANSVENAVRQMAKH
jgi:hypothetical protein